MLAAAAPILATMNLAFGKNSWSLRSHTSIAIQIARDLGTNGRQVKASVQKDARDSREDSF
jgi:hypothetical protein